MQEKILIMFLVLLSFSISGCAYQQALKRENARAARIEAQYQYELERGRQLRGERRQLETRADQYGIHYVAP